MNLLPRLTLLLFLTVLSSTLSCSAADTGRERIRFDSDWKFHLKDDTLQEPAGSHTAGLPVAGWRWKISEHPDAETASVIVPDFDDGDWEGIKDGHQAITRTRTSAWFRVVLPSTPAGPRPRLHFQSADDVATVFLNGKKIAQHEGWDEAFDVPLDGALQDGGRNVLVVLIRNDSGTGGLDAVYLQGGDEAPAAIATDGPAAVGYVDKAWRGVHLPHDFVVEGTFDPKADASHGFLPKAAGWYRKTFTLPATDKGRVLWLEFDGVYRNSIVWLNGHRLGQHASGYTSFYYDISQAANYGGENVVSVWADARQNEGWWYEGGGIYRHVYLTKLAPVHVAHWGVYVTATPSADFRSATVEVQCATEGTGDAVVTHAVLDPDGNAVRMGLEDPIGAPDLPGESATKRFVIADPALWSPDTPRLYTVRTTVLQEGKVVDTVDTAFGIRSLRWDKELGFFLNGKPFKIQGTCNHQDFAGIGVALPDAASEYKVKLLKEMGSNAFRFSHQPMAPELLDACDRLGMVVMDENRKLGDSAEILAQVESLVRRDRNHASIILWSMCNEEPTQGTERGGQRFAAMKDVVLKWDLTRPITAAMNGGYGGGISLVQDLQGFNYHIGDYDPYHAKFPGVPCYGSETASETTTRGEYADDRAKGFATSFKNVAETAWKPIAERPWMAGGFVWTGFDYRGEPTPYKWPCVNSHFGIMDTCGFPKDAYYYYLAEWGSRPVTHLMPHWNWPGKEGQEIPVRVYGNAARYELFLNGESLGAQAMPAHWYLEWKVKYAAGTLEVRGTDAQGHTAGSDKVETTGAPARLELVPDRKTLLPDGEDVIMVRCNVLDSLGRVVPTAGNEVTFRTAGPAQIAGVGNGDPSDHDPDKASQRRAFNGHCLAIVQSNGAFAGEISVTATADGLTSEPMTLRAAVSAP